MNITRQFSRLIAAFFAVVALLVSAETQTPPTPTPIAPEWMLLVSALSQQVRDTQARAQAALAKVQETICRDAKIPRDGCAVDWAAGTVGPKPIPEPVKVPTGEASPAAKK